MADPAAKKRSRDDAAKPRAPRPSKKQRKLAAYHSDSDSVAEEDEQQDFDAVNLLDSDNEDLENARADDGASSCTGSDSDSEAASDAGRSAKRQPKTKQQQERKPKFVARDAPASDDDSPSGEQEGSSDDDGDAGSDSDDSEGGGGGRQRKKSKRNDPAAFATSLSKILSTKLSTSRRADPVLARSAAAHEASRQAVDTVLEAKARKRLREQRRLAMEKGRVRDVLVATREEAVAVDPATGEEKAVVVEGETVGQILETERRLRKVAQRGVVKLFNAVRAAQVKATEAERLNRSEGVLGVGKREEKITEMSRKGFLDLIASGGGGLKKGGLEEA
ncbi:Ribosomal RNA-processing protein 15 [Pleurostoma richardsiae]|uniref:Ribosomal RNA-processing protein 15 n=1 Tax=Pleurostoma richardsiae TaxID=41990 RepID=A0AA38RDM5_9PEZI|nr:Ribosomal RNA-processing protein 15 [Pleurostoma richardsiae]